MWQAKNHKSRRRSELCNQLSGGGKPTHPRLLIVQQNHGVLIYFRGEKIKERQCASADPTSPEAAVTERLKLQPTATAAKFKQSFQTPC
jgi:hypothetical protein